MRDDSFALKIRYLKYIFFFVLIPAVIAYGKTEKNTVFSFGLIDDIQYCESVPVGTRFYSKSLNKLGECVKDFNARDLSFVIQLGDLIDKDIGSYDSVLSVFNQINTKKYHVLGNHDYGVEEVNKQQVPKIVGLVSPYYEFGSNGWRMIVLDGNDLSYYAPSKSHKQTEETEALYQKIKDRGAVNAHDWNGGLSHQQISWLDNILRQASRIGEKVLLFCHFPVYPSREENLWNDVELINLLESYPCVVALFSGHYHSGNYAKKRGIHYLTLQGMVETEDSNAYAIIEVYSDFLKVLGFGREPSRILTFRKDNS